jgi:ATP-dependent DNA helicase RecQ
MKLGQSNMFELVDSPDRSNIKLYVTKFKSTLSLYELFDWLITKSLELRKSIPRIIIFCRSIRDCGRLHTMFLSKFLSVPEILNSIAMYHSNTLDHIKSEIQTDMCDPAGNIRLLLCTSAAGMGLNFSVVNYVIHYGPPYTTDSFIQQMGRAGRDGSQSYNLLLFSCRQLRNVDREIVNYLYTADCRRQVLMSLYGGQVENIDMHVCCDNCASKCDCGKKDCGNFKYFPLYDITELHYTDDEIGGYDSDPDF